MSAQNVEIVRTLFGYWHTREMSRSFELMHDDVAIELSDPLPGFDASYRGHAAIRGFWRDWLQAWEAVDIVEFDLRDEGGEVHASWTQDMRGKGSDVPVRVAQAATFAVISGKVALIRWSNSADSGR